MSTNSRQQIFDALEVAEIQSRKGKLKWHKNTTTRRDLYIQKSLRDTSLVDIYYRQFSGAEIAYEIETIQTIGRAILAYAQHKEMADYKATVVIDGLPRSQQGPIGKQLRSLGIRTKTVRGERDEANPAIRLADAVAGLLRQAHDGDKHFAAVKKDLEQRGIIQKLP
jgi:hypothetical protein